MGLEPTRTLKSKRVYLPNLSFTSLIEISLSLDYIFTMSNAFRCLVHSL